MYDVLFAPSRKKYSEKNRPDVDCVFCAIRDEDPKVWTREIYRDDKAIVIMNIYPYSPGHIQILPKKHVEDIGELSKDVSKHLLKLLQRGITLTDETMNPIGWNVGINLGEAGASIPHLHIQIVPRFNRKVNEDQKEIHERYLELAPIFEEANASKENLNENCNCLSNLEYVLEEKPKIYLSSTPYNQGHLIVSPNKHVTDPRNLSSEQISELYQSVCKAKKIIQNTYHPVGINIGFNTGKVPNSPNHMEIHIVPRYNPESGFMEIVGNSRVVVETLNQTYKKLKPEFS